MLAANSIRLTAILLLPAISFSSCKVTTRIITSTQSADAVNVIRDTTVVHYFWGLKQAADINPGCDPRFNHLNKVEVKTKFGDARRTEIQHLADEIGSDETATARND